MKATAQLRRIVAGVIEYSQWPQLQNPLDVCVAGHELLEKSLREPALRSRHGSLRVRGIAPGSGDDVTECDLLYAGHISDVEAERLLKPLIGQPVVTIRQDPEHCGDTSFFCVYLKRSPIGLEVNLDLVARSGVRLNPWVLTLAQPDAAQKPTGEGS